MKRFIKLLAIPLILIAGTVLIYLAVSQFFKKEPKEEITIGPGEETLKEISEIKKADYLAPDFELLNIQEEKVKLSDFENKIIVLTFWTTWNPAAQDQIAILESYFQEIKESKDIVLLTINNLEDKSIVSNFIKRGDYVLKVLLDEKGEVGESYKISALPATYFINQEGKVKETYIGILSKEEIKNRVEGLYAR
jgi:peroxiredoxin